ncbi:MAG: ModD protein [Campylobacteraceae bacterium]|jgi:molybdenum transport protein|nr:ModD protein [Campylobacteraceae bacterium]
MVYISDFIIEAWIQEDIGYFDLTTTECGIADKKASLKIVSRDRCVVCASEEAARVFGKLGADADLFIKSGTKIEPETTILSVKGTARQIHLGWRVSQNILSFASTIATKTNHLVTLAREENPDILIASTRKSDPGTKSLAVKAVLSGGGVIHRLGLSKTFLMFEEHMKFFGSREEAAKKLSNIKAHLKEKKLTVEVKNIADALFFAPFADMLQLDKLTPNDIKKIKEQTKNITLIATGGITPENIKDYVRAGADLIVASWVYRNDKSIDFDIKIEPI